MPWTLLHRRADGTYVILLNGSPYHVIDIDPLWADVQAADTGQSLPDEPGPPPLEPSTRADPFQGLRDEIAELRAEVAALKGPRHGR